jgi:hypothetical protein
MARYVRQLIVTVVSELWRLPPPSPSLMLLSPDRGKGWVRGVQTASATCFARNAASPKKGIGSVNLTERRPLAGEKSMMPTASLAQEGAP